jgi:hypothetical protein
MTVYERLKKANTALTHALGLVRALGLVKKDLSKKPKKEKAGDT